jgi:hypothetical protein
VWRDKGRELFMKKEELKLMSDNREIAYVVDSKLRAHEDVDSFDLPPDLFRGRREVDFYDLVTWLEGRIVPRERVGIKKLLKDMGLKNYDLWGIVRYTRACRLVDPWWIKVTSDDTFEKCTIRGQHGYTASI